MTDREANRFPARAARYARVGAQVGGVAARLVGARALGSSDPLAEALMMARALGGLKGPIMKVAQMMATIPDLLPPAYAAELQKLQSQAPPMGAAFVKRRMIAELGADWRDRFGSFDLHPAAAASLGQVHRATAKDGAALACKLQYPDMLSAVEADLNQLSMLLSVQRRLEPAVDTSEIKEEIGARLREELDYRREAKHARLYGALLAGIPEIRVPGVHDALSSGRLLTLDWMDGRKLLEFKGAPLAVRNRLATALFKAWWHPFARHGVIHGDPHLGNYTVFDRAGEAGGINLLDYGCIRIFPARFVGGVVDLYTGLRNGDRDRIAAAYTSWGFKGIDDELIGILNVWAKFIYGPLLDDRVRTIADGVAPGDYGRREVWQVKQALRRKGPVRIPREFVFMDRAAIGLGAVFLHLAAELNFHALFEAEIGDFSLAALEERQGQALGRAGLVKQTDSRSV